MPPRPLNSVISKAGRTKWRRIERDLGALLEELWKAPSARRIDHNPRIPEKAGIYLFTEKGKPVYVGQTRNLRSRLSAHCRPSGSHNSASFAFLIARSKFKGDKSQKITRAELEAEPAFDKLFKAAKRRVSEMEIRFVICADPELRTVFEVYAAEHLGTKEFNSFETH